MASRDLSLNPSKRHAAAVSAASAVVIFVAGLVIFHRAEKKFAEYV